MGYQKVEEDFPDCWKEKVSSCPETMDSDDASRRNNMVSPSIPDCRQVDVTRCKIGKRTVRKARPVTKCQRLPQSFCARKKCNQESTDCHRTIKMTKEQHPEETCTLKPRRICTGSGCRTLRRRECRPSPPGNKEIHTICQ